MSSYNKIEKITNNLDIDEIVSLSEYIIFEDEENKTKQIVFKFRNNVNQTLQDIEFSVVEYDVNNEIIEEVVLGYRDLNAKELDEFVPNAKCNVNYDCKRVRVKVTFCKFNKTTWSNGVFKSLPFKQAQNIKSTVSTNNVVVKKEVTETKKVKASRFKLKYLKQFNTIRFSKFMAVILSIVLLVAIGYFAMVHKSTVTKAVYGDFEVSYSYSDNTICITRYLGNDKDIVIPAHIGGSLVNEIGPSVFENMNITSVEFKTLAITVRSNAFKNCTSLKQIKGDITNIDSRAFSGCTNLTEINMTSCKVISNNAFEGCARLKTVNVPRCEVKERAFIGCTNLSSLTFSTTQATTIGQIFGVTNDQLKSLTFLKVNFNEITNQFVANNYSIYTISIKQSCIAAEDLTDNTNISTIKRH